ncbi:MAG: hypothetical protein HY691_05760 [Chloroflexi bacterium]|nr:hypothetical protein [Chloroflexota bacterium]
MPRVEMVAPEALPAWAGQNVRSEDREIVRVFAQTPEIHEAWLGFARVAHRSPGRLGLRLKELIRLKSAFINHCSR